MNIAIVKFGGVAREFVKSRPEEYNVVCIADPDVSNIIAAEFACPSAIKTFDFSEAINRKDIQRVVITHPDMANGIALTALAYSKNILSLVPIDKRIFELAGRMGLIVSVAL